MQSSTWDFWIQNFSTLGFYPGLASGSLFFFNELVTCYCWFFCGTPVKPSNFHFLVPQSSTLCDPMDCSLPGSSVHGILQARVLEWVAILFSRGSCRLKDWSWHCWQVLYCEHQGGIPYPTALNTTELNAVILTHLNTVTVTWAWITNGTPYWPLVNTSNHQTTLQHYLTNPVISKPSSLDCWKLQRPGHLLCFVAFSSPSFRLPGSSASWCWDLLALHLQDHELRFPQAATDLRFSKHWLCADPMPDSMLGFPRSVSSSSYWTHSLTPSKPIIFCRTSGFPNPLCSHSS